MATGTLDEARNWVEYCNGTGNTYYTGSGGHFANVFLPHHAGRCIRHLASLIEGVRFRQHIVHPVAIAYDEWNGWTHGRATAENGHEQPFSRSLDQRASSGLCVAGL